MISTLVDNTTPSTIFQRKIRYWDRKFLVQKKNKRFVVIYQTTNCRGLRPYRKFTYFWKEFEDSQFRMQRSMTTGENSKVILAFVN